MTPSAQPSSSEQYLSQALQLQLSLVDDSPRKADDVSVDFEVRAKAEKYDPNRDDDVVYRDFTPWRLQGVGPLRLFKHNRTGEVRIQMHCEPRGILMLHQRLLSEYTYKAEPYGPRSIMSVAITAAADDGENWETWRITTRGSGPALANALEEHKMANAAKDE